MSTLEQIRKGLADVIRNHVEQATAEQDVYC